MLDILYYLFYTERKKQQQQQPTRENAEGEGGKRSDKEAAEKLCSFKWGEWGGEEKKKSYIRTQERGDVFPKITVNKFPAWNFPDGPAVKNPPANAGDMGSTPGRGRFYLPWGNEAWALPLLTLSALEPQQEKRCRGGPGAAAGGQPERSPGDPARPNT